MSGEGAYVQVCGEGAYIPVCGEEAYVRGACMYGKMTKKFGGVSDKIACSNKHNIMNAHEQNMVNAYQLWCVVYVLRMWFVGV